MKNSERKKKRSQRNRTLNVNAIASPSTYLCLIPESHIVPEYKNDPEYTGRRTAVCDLKTSKTKEMIHVCVQSHVFHPSMKVKKKQPMIPML